IERSDVTQGRKAAVQRRIHQSLQETGGSRHIISPGCGIRYPLREEILMYIHEIIHHSGQ
ncbi:hypothetical protein CSA57_03245, partial [candidate division KSB3 bacterium]